MSPENQLFLVKLGGSLITDKSRPETARVEIIAELARQVLAATEELAVPLLVGHGSGSFGHVAASQHQLHRDSRDQARPLGISLTQQVVWKLHRLVVSALREVGVAAYSLATSSFLVASGGQPVRIWPEPLLLALRQSLVPVVFGDVVMDREWGCSICSTESLFTALVPALGSRGMFVRRAVWLGDTDGVYDSRGETIAEITRERLPEIAARLQGAAGTDVTGGIRHRLTAAGVLAEQGIGSWIGNGRRPGTLLLALRGEAGGGTEVVPGR